MFWIRQYCDMPNELQSLECLMSKREVPALVLSDLQGAQPLMAREARKKGWQTLRGVGWVCRDCYNKHMSERKKR